MDNFSWRTYSSNKFRGRTQTIAKIQDWLRDSERQVLALVGPPGSGKTWLLKKLMESLSSREIPCFVIWLNSPDLVNRSAGKAEQVIDGVKAADWVREIYSQARKEGCLIPDFDPALTQVASLQRLVEALCQQNGSLQVVVLVDGYDEVESSDPDPGRRIFTYAFADRILAPLIQRGCARLVIAHRGALGLQHPALSPFQRQLVTEFDAVEPIAPYQQYMDYYLGNPGDESTAAIPGVNSSPAPLTESEFAAWQMQLPEYPWDNPYINNYLFAASYDKAQGGLALLSPVDLKICIRDLIQKVDGSVSCFPPLSDESFSILRQIARLGTEFTREDLVTNKIPISVFDPKFRLFIDVYGVVLLVPRSSRYTMLDSLRGLFRDLDTLENKR